MQTTGNDSCLLVYWQIQHRSTQDEWPLAIFAPSALHEQVAVRKTRCPSRSNHKKLLEIDELTFLVDACGDEICESTLS